MGKIRRVGETVLPCGNYTGTPSINRKPGWAERLRAPDEAEAALAVGAQSGVIESEIIQPRQGRRYVHRYRGLRFDTTWTMDYAGGAASSMALNLRPSGAEKDERDAKL